MTEKRFSVKKSRSGLFYRDGDYEIDNTIQFIIETVEMKLNQLSDENEELKKENYELHKRLGDFEQFEEHIKERTSKTFVKKCVYFNIGITDKDKLLTFNEVVDLLNELHDENQLLHKINEDTINFMYDNFDSNIIFTDRELNDICNEMGWELSEKGIKIKQLEKENEQLKQFKEKVFTLIEEELEEHPYLTLTEKWNPNCKNYHSCRGNHEKNVFYASRHTLLEKLREKLSYD